ncbi:ComEC/Rec2 family competence protein [Maribacter algicola]|uniref:ComEC/Rec2 family competence protein n=1 Tax=Meishania litoralis TaxID=3434685 RepID=A0ACC7LHC7_9FLAO
MVKKVLGAFFFLSWWSCSITETGHDVLDIKDFPNRSEDFSLWQMAPFREEVQMGYLLRTDDGKIIVIDGGGVVTAPVLEGHIAQLGGTVHTWILTHPHLDHIGAFLEVIKNQKIEIKRTVHVSLPEAWVQKNESITSDLHKQYTNAISSMNCEKIAMKTGDTLSLGKGVQLRVIGAFNESVVQNAVNNSSMVFRVESKSKSVLFLGDLGIAGGRTLLANVDPDLVKADYVQMAHHGQHGVDRDFYKAVSAKYALWPTPKWLWENRADGQGYNTGNFKTFEVRVWMDELGIKKNYVSGLDGTVQID